MISAEARPYIDASVPVLRTHGLAITTAFYANMFAAHPELTNLFNMGNQASGVQQQSLAAAVFAYAANIDNAAALEPVIQRIVHKHVSIGIREEHYPIVGHFLLGAIEQVLGDAATPALIAAWDEAYSELAGALISVEKAMYQRAGITPGQLRSVRIVDIRNESDDVKSFVLEAVDGQPLPSFEPGQYVSVSITFADGSTQLRQYSLSDAAEPQHMRISVKREREHSAHPAGRVSNWLHDEVGQGSTLQITHPFGDFTPDATSAAPIVLLSAGIGITPMISVLNRIAQVHPWREVIFGHAARSKGAHSHRTDVATAKASMPNLQVTSFYEELHEHDADDASDSAAIGGVKGAIQCTMPSTILHGRMDITKLPRWSRVDTDVYLCGPRDFMHDQWRALLEIGIPVKHLHREVFGPELLDFVS